MLMGRQLTLLQEGVEVASKDPNEYLTQHHDHLLSSQDGDEGTEEPTDDEHKEHEVECSFEFAIDIGRYLGETVTEDDEGVDQTKRSQTHKHQQNLFHPLGGNHSVQGHHRDEDPWKGNQVDRQNENRV